MGLRITPTPDVVGATQVDFAISGSVRDLQPGAPVPLDVAVANPNRATLLLTALNVRVKALRAAGATTARPCTLADFWVGQFSGTYPIAVPPAGTSTLASLSIASSLWPRVLMLDRAVNQDGCMGASLSLAYGGAGRLR